MTFGRTLINSFQEPDDHDKDVGDLYRNANAIVFDDFC